MNGRVQLETVGSQVLKGNPLGDPHVRELPVYLPPGYGSARGRRYPVVYYLVGFTGTARGALNVHAWRENVVQRLDRLIGEGEAPECLLVIPDCFTRYGGSQYLNSPATGRYEDHVVEELVGFVDDKFAARAEPAGRALLGGSSGGFGALTLGLRHPGVFGHVFCHSGDMHFEMCYGPDIPKCVSALGRYGGRFSGFLRELERSKRRDQLPHELVNMAAMAACYSPNPRSALGFDLPFDERTGDRVPAVWRRWLAHDPALLAPRRAAALRRLRTLFFDCGRRDEFFLHLGARRLHDALRAARVPHRYLEHDAGHFELSERHEVSFRLLRRAFGR
ncbi:MAG: esterase [Elusimicrobia bacterium]|nr:esterase [Elusimicrobiota bacterium]